MLYSANKNQLQMVFPPLCKKRLITFILASIVLFYFIFAPGIQGAYYAGDDFRYAFGGHSQRCTSDDGFSFVLTLGRPIQAYLDCANYKLGYTFERMSMLRFCAVFFMGCGAGLLAEILCYYGVAFWTAFCAAGCVYLLPRLYFDAVITAAISLPFTLLLVLVAYGCIHRIHGWRKYKAVGFGFVGLLIYAALLTYPAMAFFFCSLILAKALFSKLSDSSKTIREIIQEAALFVGVCFIYFIWAAHNMRYHALTIVPVQYHVDHPNFDIGEIINRLKAMGNMFSTFWVIIEPHENPLIRGWIIIGVLITGLLAGLYSFFNNSFYSRERKNSILSLAKMVLAVLFLFILSSALMLVIPEPDVGSRISYAMAASGFMLIFWCVFRISFIFPAFLRASVAFIFIALLFLIQAYSTNLHVGLLASGFEKKLNLIKTPIAQYAAKNPQPHRIHFILFRPVYPYSFFFLANGGLMQVYQRGSYSLKWCSLARGITEDEPHHQKEALACIHSLKKNEIAITYSFINEPFTKTDNMLIIHQENLFT